MADMVNPTLPWPRAQVAMAQLQSQQLAAQVAAIRAQAKLQPSAASGGAPPRPRPAANPQCRAAGSVQGATCV